MEKHHLKISKFLSLVLRHEPGKIAIELDSAGWVAVSQLLSACAEHGFSITREELDFVVANNDKKRFAFSEDGRRIRASQGHSVEIELDYQPTTPPEVLYHGTASRFLPSIQSQGLLKGQRNHVHLSQDAKTAIAVGRRHGKPVVLKIRAGEMNRAGHSFFLSANGVWLTEHVPPNFFETHEGP
ncbi:MAG TPA: RNA 2'-phosphotransferase [Verrucomicrobiae bacterium]|nr:RNA 2'-phosphotransferase [Verrucomicrobiae bacterium]